MRKIIPMMLASLLYPAAGYSLGMGEIRLHSGLNQPLSAEIDLLSVGNEDLTTISAGLASSELFAQLGIDRSSTLLLVTFEVQKRANGAFYIKATSKQPIREPYLDFLLEVNWKSGHALREYTVLLDPPEFAKQTPVTIQPPAEAVTAPLLAPASAEQPAADATAQTPETAAANTAEGTPSPEQAAQPGEQKSAEAPTAEETTAATDAQASPVVAVTTEANVAPAEATKIEEPADVAGVPAKSGVITYGPVRGDETLWSIAKRMRPNRSVTVPQVMSALVHQNPYAFYGKNANRMKAGHVLRLDPAQLAEISREEAAREIALQGRDWHDYKQRAATQAGTRAPTTGTESQEGSAVAAAKKEEPRLKLVTPQEGGKPSDKMAAPGTSATDADALRKELMLAIETSEAQKQENEDLRKRLQELEGQVAAMQRLLSLKDNDLAALQRQAGQAGEKSAPAKGGVTQPPAVVAAPVASQPAAAPAQPATAPAAGVEQKAPATTPAPAATTPPATPEKKAPAAKPVITVPPPAPVQEPSFFSGILSNPVVLGVIAFCTFLVGILGVVILRRRRSGASFQESILMGGSPSMLKAKTAESGQKSGQKEETSFFSDFAVSGMSDIRAEDSEVDPLTEADVYMAYQRFQQAEELLREAMKQQDRPELHVKLLEVYHATRNKEAFEAEALKVMPMLNGTGPLWEKVLVLGHELLPQHALFAKAPEKAAAAAAGHADGRLDNEVLDIGLDLDALAEEMESGGAQDTGEFNLDLGVDFSDLDTAKPAAAKTSAPIAPAAAPAPAPAAVQMASPAAAAPKKEEAPLEFDLGDLDLHLDETPAVAPAAKQEAKPTPAASGPEAIDFGALDLGDLELGSAGKNDQPLPADALNSTSLAGGGESNEIDLGDFDLGALNAEPAPAAEKAPDASLGDFDLGDLSEIQVEEVPNPESEEENFFANLDEADTKLDLARAYMEMGDPDGARGILDEVVQEGNATQKQQAQELLKQIA